MRYISNGSGKIPLISLIAILSISLTVNLPGLGISPIEDKLTTVFPTATELEIQLLTILPNLVIIPFILFSGKLSTPRNQIYILAVGLVIYAIAGVMYLFADTMIELIFISCVLGLGCGFVIPLAASLIAVNFSGSARAKQLGMKSGISNFAVIFATLFVGWIANYGWHLSFLVYLTPIIPLCLIPFMTDTYIKKHKIVDPAALPEPMKEPPTPKEEAEAPVATAEPKTPNSHFAGKTSLYLMIALIGLYMVLTYATDVVSYYLPFTMEHYKLTSGDIGVATAMYFLAATLAGFSLTWAINHFGQRLSYISIGMCVAGLAITGFVHYYWSYILGVFVMGYGYGIMQPIIYDKTTFVAPTAADATRYFSYVLTGNYVAISLVPFIVRLFSEIFDAHGVNFSYILNACILLIVIGIAYWKRKTFVFKINPQMYKK